MKEEIREKREEEGTAIEERRGREEETQQEVTKEGVGEQMRGDDFRKETKGRDEEEGKGEGNGRR